jgi:drug/metabolite transporter (DMT)-like permease
MKAILYINKKEGKMYIPILGALALSIGTILERIVLRIKKINIKLYQTASFFAIVLAMLPLLYFFWRIDQGAMQLKNILIFAGVILFSIIANLFVFYSLKWEKVTNLEPARILEPLFVVLLALVFSFFFDEFERNLNVIIPAIIAAFALVFPHIKKEHLQFNRYFIAAIFGSFFFALELVLSRLILDFYSPITFYFLRCASIFIISAIAFRPKLKPLKDKKISILIFITGVTWVVYRVAVYFGYLKYGVTLTTLILMLSPVFIYLIANIFLKEKLNWKNILSSVIIIACIVYVLLT